MKNSTTTTMPARDVVLDVRGAARYLGCHPETVRRLVRAGKLPAYRGGTRLIRISRLALDRLLAGENQ